MWDTTLTIQRPPNTTYVGTDGRNASGIIAQVDQASDKEVIDLKMIYSFQGTFVYKVYIPFWYATSLIKQDDILIDERVLDPDRGTLYRYKVVGRPHNFLYDHQECYCIVEGGG